MNISHQRHYFERRVSIGADPIDLAAALARSGSRATYFVYERDGEWSVALGAAFELTADVHGVHRIDATGKQSCPGGDCLAAVEAALASIPLRGWRAYGTASFEFAYLLHGIEANLGTEPLLHLTIPEVEIRLQRGTALVRALTSDELERMVDVLASSNRRHARGMSDVAGLPPLPVPPPEVLPARLLETTGAAKYKELVAAATTEIAARKLHKVIASRVVPVAAPVDLIATYVAGRRQNTPARSFVVNCRDLKFAGFSPETVLEVTAGGQVMTQPLAGTRALVSDDDENARLRAELLSNSKELAEHAMSVKLAFEELSRVCKQGSVTVNEFMAISRRGTVQHLASRLSGMLETGNTAWTAFQVLFPAITASGIPKREAVDWIRRHEAESRGLYSGAVLTLDHDGAMDAALVLRTIFQRGSSVWLRAGAGIVAESTPERELEETCEKLQSVARHLVPPEFASEPL
ncbi:salicylate synthase [Sorangium sp. So ce426]|uniref:salicylate synthase n=1 Tax=Sorangium sp. So ce426 TaxID=3133312 RepID=UPI003F5AEBE3